MKKKIKQLKRAVMLLSASLVFITGLFALATRLQPLTPSQLVRYAEDKIVVLNGPSNPNSGGTGFIVVGPSGKTYTLTNKHVCGLAENGIMSAQTKYHAKTLLLHVLEIDTKHDLCLLEPIPGVSGYKISDAPALMYDSLYSIGHPHLEPNTFTFGLMREQTRIELQVDVKKKEECVGPFRQWVEVNMFFFIDHICVESTDSISTSLTIYPGNSGSPVFNSQHYVVGVVFAGSNRDHYGYYVPLNYVTDFLKSR